MANDAKADALAVRQKTLEKMPAGLRGIANGIRSKLEKANAGYLQVVHEIGERVAELQDSPADKYGPDPVRQLMTVLDMEDRGFLIKAARFFRLVSESTLKTLLESRSKAGNRPITWGHIIAIMAVDQDGGDKVTQAMRAKFKEFAKMVFAEDLSVTELTDRVRAELRGGSRGGGGGRPLSIPPRLSGKLDNLAGVLNVVVRNHFQIWSHQDYGFERAVADLPADQIDESLLASIAARRELAQQAVDALNAELTILDRTYATAAEKAGFQPAGAVERAALPAPLPALAVGSPKGELVADIPPSEAA